MSTLAEIEEAIETLPDAEVEVLADGSIKDADGNHFDA